MSNTYQMSNGERVLKTVVDSRVRKAKAQKIEQIIDDFGYVFCEDCKRNDCVPIDCSHDLSVDQCQKQGKTELSWDINNITMRGRRCHNKHDKTF